MGFDVTIEVLLLLDAGEAGWALEEGWVVVDPHVVLHLLFGGEDFGADGARSGGLVDSLDVLAVEFVRGEVTLAGLAVELGFSDVGLDVELEFLLVAEGAVADGAAFFGDFLIVLSHVDAETVGLREGLAADVTDVLLLLGVTSHM